MTSTKQLALPDAFKFGKFKFKRFGSSYHLQIKNGDDLARVGELDGAHWVATNAPISTINADEVFLRRIDTDADGRIRVEEVRQAIRWLLKNLKSADSIEPWNRTLVIDDIDRSSPDGERIFQTAQKILARLQLPESPQITLNQIREVKNMEQEGGLDEAGVVLPDAAPGNTIKVFLQDIIETIGGREHPGGQMGVDEERLEVFIEEIKTYLGWRLRARLGDRSSSNIMPLGKETPAAFRLYSDLRPKIDQYFALSDMERIDPRLEERLMANNGKLSETDILDTQVVSEFLERSPIARPREDGKLRFADVLNARYEQALRDFRIQVVRPVLGTNPSAMSRDHWSKIKKHFEAHEAWVNSEPETTVGEIPLGKLIKYREDARFHMAAQRLIDDSYQTSLELDGIRLVEKLTLFQAYMIPFVNSFVSFPDLYDAESRALFEMGTLIMDGRHFTLSVKVPDIEQHAKFSDASNMFVLYVEVSVKEGSKLFEAAVPVTSGNRGNLQVNKWGIFRDIHGVERQARVIKIVENPISLSEAVLAPFKRLGRAVTAKLEEINYKAEETLSTRGVQAVGQVNASLSSPEAGTPQNPQNVSGGMLAGGGIAIAALGSSAAFITKTLASLSFLELMGGIVAAILAAMIPATVVAYIKLRKRDLSSILEGAGWGINARMRLTRFQAQTFTLSPAYPDGSEGVRHKSKWTWIALAVIILGVAAYFGWISLTGN